jgi:short subunit dehydrogenase-like uncharacterized protein
MKTLMIYGATGYTGRMAAEHAKALGLALVIAGRNAERLAPLAAQREVQYRVFTAQAPTAEALAAVEAARRVLGGERRSGFESPAHLFGVGFAQTIAGTRILDF